MTLANTQPNTQIGARRFTRYDTNITATFENEHHSFSVFVENISGGGAQLRVSNFLMTQIRGAKFSLIMEEFGRFNCTPLWNSMDRIGVSFDIAINQMRMLDERLTERFG